MQLSELRKKAKRGPKPEAQSAKSPEVDVPVVSGHDPHSAVVASATVSEEDEFFAPAAVQPVASAAPSMSLLESIAAVEASPYVADVANSQAEPDVPEAPRTGLLEDLADAPADDDLVEYISFVSAGEPYVIRISRVKEIIRPRRLAIVPRAPSYVRGVLSLRGEMIPVLDLRRSLGLALDRNMTPALDSRIIVLAHNGAKMGLQVDRLEGVIRLDENLFRDPSEVQGSRDHRFLQAIGRFRGSFVIVLDVEEFFARGEK